MTGTEDRTLTCPVSAPASPPDGHTGAPRPSGPTHSPQAATGPHSTTPPFTAQDLALVALIAEGLHNPEIGVKLGVTTGTAKYQLAVLIRRHRTGDRAGLVARAIRSGQHPVELLPADQRITLPPHSLRVLQCVAAGLSSPQIGAHLGIPAETVRTRLSRLFRLLGVGSRPEAVVAGYRHGLLRVTR